MLRQSTGGLASPFAATDLTVRKRMGRTEWRGGQKIRRFFNGIGVQVSGFFVMYYTAQK